MISETISGEMMAPGGVTPSQDSVPAPAPASTTTAAPAPAPTTTTPAPAQGATEPEEPLFQNNDADNLFNETPATPPPGGEATEPSADDLFPPAEDTPPAPADEQPAAPAEDAADELDNLFGAVSGEAHRFVSFQQQPWRTWTDDTGWYETRGQLASISDAGVRIFKDNGRHCTVPFHRLSLEDVSYVLRVARVAVSDGGFRIAGR